MEAHLQRLRDYLSRSSLTAVEVRDGMVSAYLVVSRLNQLQGSPEVGLKQDEKGLLAHITGFMGAVFWERGFNFDAPTINNLAEIKMMLDGMAQIYAMPDTLQMALNEMCDILLSRGRGEPAIVSPAVMDLLKLKIDEDIQVPDGPTAAPKAAEPDLDRMPDESEPAEPVSAPEPVSASASEPQSEPEPWYATSIPMDVTKSELSSVLDAFNDKQLDITSDRPDEPRRDEPALESETGAPTGETAEMPAAAEAKPAKKKSPRKKAAAGEGDAGDAVPKPPRKRGGKVKTPPPEQESVTVPEDYMQLAAEPSLSEALAEPEAPAEERFQLFHEAPEPAPADEPFFQSAPESEPAAPADEPAAEPVGVFHAGSEQTDYTDAGPKPQVVLEQPAEAAPAKSGKAGTFFLGLFLGLVFGAGGLGGYYFLLMRPQADQKAAELTKQTEELHSQLSAVTTEKERLRNQVDEEAAVRRKAPAKPDFYRAGNSVILYWPDAARKYVLYRAKGEKDDLAKVQPEPLQRNLFMLLKPERGLWRYAVAALDKDGKETEKSEVLRLKLPLAK
jgi:hypothetical protein